MSSFCRYNWSAQVILTYYSIFDACMLVASYADEADAINARVSLAAVAPRVPGDSCSPRYRARRAGRSACLRLLRLPRVATRS
jgi:hypothetical protein